MAPLPVDLPNVSFRQITVDNNASVDREYFGDVKGLGDIDGDGYIDIAFGGNELVWYAYPHWRKSIVSISDEQFSTDMQLADMDNDGDLDMIVPDGRKGKLCWFENPRPAGDAQNIWKVHVVGYQVDWTHDVEIGDINRDGKLDIVTRRGSTEVWLQNNPDSFTRVPIRTARANGEGTALADINGDGRIDIVQNGYWLEGPVDSVNGEWTKHIISESWPSQLSVAVADVNGDQVPDVILAPAESGGRLCWYQSPNNRRTTQWTEHLVDDTVEYVHSLQTGDFNNDGVLDIATAEMHQSAQRRVAVYLKGGSRQWKKQILSTKGSHNLRAGDIGGDSDLDLIGANWGGDYHPLEIWENRLIESDAVSKGWTYVQVDARRAKWGDYDIPAFGRYFGLAAGDVNGDGLEDIVSGRYVYLNPGTNMAGAWTRSDFGVNVDGMLIVDVDGDGQADVIAESLPAVYWLKPIDSSGTAWKAILIGVVPATEHVNSQGYALAQIVSGGRPEIVLGGGNGVYYFEIPDTPGVGNWPRKKIAAGTSEEGIGVGDIDGDGHTDIAIADKDGHGMFWWRNPGTRSGEWAKSPVGKTAEWVDRCAIADINQDGRLDIVVSEETAYRGASVYWFEQPGNLRTLSWPRHTVLTQFSTNSLDVADMDGDGAMDIVTGEHRGTRKLAIWKNGKRGSNWTEHIISAGKENHLGARVIDLNGDKRPEIVGIAWDTYAFLHLWTPQLTATSRPPRR